MFFFVEGAKKKSNFIYYYQISYPLCSAVIAVHNVNERVICCLPRIGVPCPLTSPPLPRRSSSPPVLFWPEIVLDHFNTFSLCPIGRLFQMEGIMVLNVFPFCTKLQNHTQPVKKGLSGESGPRPVPHPTPPHPCFHPYCSMFHNMYLTALNVLF